MSAKLELLLLYFGIRKFATHWVSLGFFCTLVPLSVFTPEVGSPPHTQWLCLLRHRVVCSACMYGGELRTRPALHCFHCDASALFWTLHGICSAAKSCALTDYTPCHGCRMS